MSATLMTLLQTSLLQQPQSHQQVGGTAPTKATEQKVAEQNTAASALVQPAAASVGGAGIAPLLVDLVRVVTEISRTDQMIQKTADAAPHETEALKWHEISLHALRWSRDALVQQQDTLLAQMKHSVQPSAAKVSEPMAPEPVHMATEPAPEEEENEGTQYVGSLRSDLERLRSYDPACCLHVRKIKPLGVKSPEKLHGYFSRFGRVLEVLVSHSFEKPSLKRHRGRVRPASLGFIVMESQAIAQAILSEGETRVMDLEDGCYKVQIQSYEPSAAEAGPAEAPWSPSGSSEPESEEQPTPVFCPTLLAVHEQWLDQELERERASCL